MVRQRVVAVNRTYPGNLRLQVVQLQQGGTVPKWLGLRFKPIRAWLRLTGDR